MSGKAFLLGLLISLVANPSLAEIIVAPGTNLEVNASLWQESNQMMSRGEARWIKEDGTTAEDLPVTGTHSINGLQSNPFSFMGWYLAVIWANNPVAGQCYTATVWVQTTLFNPQNTSPQVCFTPELPPSPDSDDPFNQEHCDCDPDPEVICGCSPILIDMDGDGFRLVGIEDAVSFDINATGTPLDISWTHPATDDAFLVLDRNGNGSIDDGSELFGTATPQPASGDPNGFRALAVYDTPEHGGNGDGVITADDAVWVDLQLWRDASHDGLSQPWELTPLAASAVRSVDLDYVQTLRRDAHGNWFRWMSRVRAQRRPHQAVDVIFRGR